MIFGLCRSCIEDGEPRLCKHSDKFRALEGVWTTHEVEFAVLQRGYRLECVFEARMYSRQEPIFREYYLRLARLKLSAEGFPKDVQTEEAKLQYVEKMNGMMPGLDLKSEEVCKNQSLRKMAKDLSNIGLGKLSQSCDKTNTRYASNWMDIAAVKYSDKEELISVFPVTDYLAEVKSRKKLQRLGLHQGVQPIVYSFVTAFARVKLLSDMRKIMKMGGRCFYTDTDSIIFDYPSNGDLANLEKELKVGTNAYGYYKHECPPIQQFISMGPKNYSFRTEGGDEVIKIRGFSLKSQSALDTLNHTAMKEVLHDWVLKRQKRTLRTCNFSMSVDRQNLTVSNRPQVKRYDNANFTKRWIPSKDGPHQLDEETFSTIPFGAVHLNYEDC